MMFLYFKLYILLFFIVFLQSPKCMWYTTFYKNNGYSGKSFIINDNGKLAWNLNYKKEIILCEEHWL